MKTKLVTFLLLTSSFLVDAQAGSATWNLNPANGFWQSAANWTPATIPNSPRDVATFDLSNTTSISTLLSTPISVAGLTFNPGANAFTITLDASHSLEIN